MRRSVMKTSIGIATVLLALLLLGTEAAADNCEDALKTGAYDCRFVRQTGETFAGCMRFVVPGEIGEFDIRSRIEFPAGVRNLLGGCSCRTKISGGNLELDEARTFDCIEPGRDALLISGQASRLKITEGHTMTPNGTSMIFACERPGGQAPDVSCPAGAPAGQSCAGDICCEGRSEEHTSELQ